MPKMKNKQVSKYKHKSGSEKLKIRLQNQLKTAAMDKGQTKLNFNSFAVAIPDEVVNTPNTLPSSSSGHHSFSAGVEDDACNATPSHYHDTDNDMITNASSESDSESGLNLPEQPDAQDDTDTDGDEDEGTCDDLAAELAHDQPSSLGLHTVGNFISPNMADPLGVKLFFLENHPIQPPPTACNLPFNSTKIYFRDITGSDPVQRKWLSYAHHNRSIYCSVCMAFGEQRDSAFVSGVKVDVKSIYNKVNKHEISDSHRCAVDAYLRVDKHKSLDVLLKSKRLQEVEKNRLVLSRIIDIILTLAKQNMAFRAYRFEAAHHIKMEEPAGCRNQGNFLELVKLVAKYDPILKAHVQQSIFKSQIMLNKREKTKSVCTKAGRGNLLTFLSKTTVNNIIKIVGKEISASVAKDVILAKEFSLEVDSTQDVSVTDQLSVCVRYVLNGEVNERLIKMLAQHSSTGEAQYNLLKAELGHLGIDLKNLVSDSFDGAANMKGAYKGLQSILKRDAPNSVFTHCHAHVLNLVIGDTTMCVISAQDLFDLIQKTAVFFSYSYKRTDLWKRIVSNSDAHEKQRRLQKLGATRWNSKHTALQGIFETTSTPNEERTRYVHLIEALHTLGYHEAVDPATATEARNYLGKWTSFDTILTSFIFLHIFEASTPVSKYFQTKGLDYIAAWNQVVALRESIHLLSGKFDDIFKEAEEFVNAMMLKTEDLENVVITSTLAEKRKRSKKLMPGEVARDESVDLDTKTRYRVDTFVATMDQIQSSLKRRFEDNEDLMKSFAYIDPRRFQDVRSGALSLQDKNAVDALKRIASLAKVDHEQLVRELKEFASSYDSLSLALHAEFKERSEVEKNPISIFLDDDCEDDNSENDTNVNLGLTQEQQQEENNTSQYGSIGACVEKTEKKMDVDDMLAHAGDFSRYQHLLMFLFGLINILSAFHYFGQIFIAVTPEHWCHISELKGKITDETSKDLWTPDDDSKCTRFDLDLSNASLADRHEWGTRPCDAGWDYNRTSGYQSIVTELDWVCTGNWKPAAGQSLFFIGCVIGTLSLGIMADTVGRLHVLVIANMMAMVGNVATSFTTSFPLYAACRFFAGMATDNNFAMLYIIVLEYMRPSRRTLGLNLTIGVGYTLGCVAAPWIALSIGDWRHFLVAVSAPLMVVPAFYFLVPESARWLLSKGRVDEAIECFQRVARFNKRSLTSEMVEDFKMSVKMPIATESTPSVLGLFKTPNLRRKTCILVFKSMVLTLCYDAIARNVGNMGLNPFAVFSITSTTTLPSCLVILFLQDRVGRKAMASGSLFLTGVFNVAAGAVLAARGGTADPVLVTSLAVVGRLGVNIAYNSGMQYAAELIPTEVRGQGVAAIHMAGYLVLFLSPYILYTENYWLPIPDLILGTLAIMGSILCLLLPETLHRALPVSLADGEAFGEGEAPWEFAWSVKAKSKREKLFSSTQQLVHDR